MTNLYYKLNDKIFYLNHMVKDTRDNITGKLIIIRKTNVNTSSFVILLNDNKKKIYQSNMIRYLEPIE